MPHKQIGGGGLGKGASRKQPADRAPGRFGVYKKRGKCVYTKQGTPRFGVYAQIHRWGQGKLVYAKTHNCSPWAKRSDTPAPGDRNPILGVWGWHTLQAWGGATQATPFSKHKIEFCKLNPPMFALSLLKNIDRDAFADSCAAMQYFKSSWSNRIGSKSK